MSYFPQNSLQLIANSSSFSRNTIASYFDSNGNLQFANVNVVRTTTNTITGISSVLLESNSTNLITNPRGEGVAFGVRNGGFPIGWSMGPLLQANGGMYFVGAGNENGIPYVDINILDPNPGLTASGCIIDPIIGANTFGVPASPNTKYTDSFYAKIVGGTMGNFNEISIKQWDSVNGSFISTYTTNITSSIANTTGSLANNRYIVQQITGSNNQINGTAFGIKFSTTGTANANVTIRIGGPQIELGGNVTSLMLPPVGQQGQTFRGDDITNGKGFLTLSVGGIDVGSALTQAQYTANLAYNSSGIPLAQYAANTANTASITANNSLPLSGGTVTGILNVNGVGTALSVANNISVGGSSAMAGLLTAQSGINVGTNSSAQQLQLNGPGGSYRNLVWSTANSKRWQISLNSTTESGNNIGSDLDIINFADNGSTINNPVFRLTRSSGRGRFSYGLDINGGFSATGGTILDRLNIGNGATLTYTGNYNTVLSIPINVTGNLTSQINYINTITASGDTANVSFNGSGLTLLGILQNFGGPGMQGNRNGLRVQMQQVGDIGNNTTNASFTGGEFWLFPANYAQGGGAGSSWYGINPQVVVTSNTSGVKLISGGEINVANQGNVGDITGIQIVIPGSHKNSGTSGQDSAIVLGNQTGMTARWKYAWRIGGSASPDVPMAADGVIGWLARTMTLQDGFDLSNGIFTGNTWNDGKVVISGTGNITVANNATIGKNIIISTPSVPSTNSSSGITGQIAWDSGYVYVCVANNAWKRAALSTW